MNKISDATIALVKSFGFDVYMRSPNDSWLYFTDGKNIGYLQNDSGGYSLSTVHKPNISTGTGYQIGRELDELTKELLESCFVRAPRWGYSSAGSVVKYRDIADFIKASAFNSEYKQV